MTEYQTVGSGETGTNQTFIIGIVGIAASFFMGILGWLPSWIIFGTFIVAAWLYGSRFFATGIVASVGTGVFSSIGWFPLWAYFTGIFAISVAVAVRIATAYINTGAGK